LRFKNDYMTPILPSNPQILYPDPCSW